jgi:hypothetical protein
MNMNLSMFRNPKIIDHRKNGFVERTESLRNFNKGSGTGCINKSQFK